MSARLYELLDLLADGKFHSGETLGKVLGVSRAAVWKRLATLQTLGLELHAVSGKGYRLTTPFEPLSREAILQRIPAKSAQLLSRMQLLHETDSTNQQLLLAARTGEPAGSVCMAEYQSGGRGRRGRKWLSPYGSTISLSLLWRFEQGTAALGGLSLAVAVALMRTVTQLGLRGAGIKWPNDILVDGRKLAGILIDVGGESSGPCYVVIGIGLNYRLPQAAAAEIAQPWTDLWQHDIGVGRNEVAAVLLTHLLGVIEEYEDATITGFREEWSRWDLTRDRDVVILNGDKRIQGIARGIDENGFLLLEQQREIRRFAAGEVSLRQVHDETAD